MRKILFKLMMSALYHVGGISRPSDLEVLNSALAVNFNTIHAVRQGKTIRSAEKQTPITPLN